MSEQQTSDPGTPVDPRSAVVLTQPNGDSLAISPTVQPDWETAMVFLASSGTGAAEVAERLDHYGGILCSHSLETSEGVSICTRLLGSESTRMDTLGDGHILDIDAWLMTAASKVHQDGQIDGFLAISFLVGDKVIRSSSHWVRRSLGTILRLSELRPWQPIRVKLQRRTLTVGCMLSFGYMGTIKALNGGRSSGKTR